MRRLGNPFTQPRLILATLCVLTLAVTAQMMRTEPVSNEISRVPAPVIPDHPGMVEPAPARDINALWQKYETLQQSFPKTENLTATTPLQSQQDNLALTEQQRERLQRQQAREQRAQIRSSAKAEIQAAIARLPEDGNIQGVIHTLETLNKRLDTLGLEQQQSLKTTIAMLHSSQKVSDISNRILEAATSSEHPDPSVIEDLTNELRAAQQQFQRNYSELYKEG